MDGDFSTAYSKMANEWRFIEGPKSQGDVKIETLVQETRQQIAKELRGDSPVRTQKGKLLNDFKKYYQEGTIYYDTDKFIYNN